MRQKTNKYTLVMNLPFGNLKKGTIFEFDNITKTAKFPNGAEISPFDVTDKTFVKECVPVPYTVGDNVIYAGKLYIITEINYTNGYCDLKEFYSNVNEHNVFYKSLKSANVYWFVNSRGAVSSTYYGKDETADLWRSKSKNMFDTKAECEKYKNIVFKSK